MTKVMIFGNQEPHSIAIRQSLLARNVPLVLYPTKKNETMVLTDAQWEKVIQGDPNDLGKILQGMIGCDLVCLSGVQDSRVTWRIMEAMKLLGLKRLICLIEPADISRLSGMFSDGSGLQKQRLSRQMELSVGLIEESECDYTFLYLPNSFPKCSQTPNPQANKKTRFSETDQQVAELIAQIVEEPAFLINRRLYISSEG
ncbi:NAD(P)H-binding protein [Enterococcus sp.]|uniref:NAD(P)H-binding protein n=1 Tax=Enterococcus sp. TaxID=35783 RepID=UPI0025BFF69E|nr:NAD(P)H-binding protein [Enterococcus sp.]